jgi:hypothetical protein
VNRNAPQALDKHAEAPLDVKVLHYRHLQAKYEGIRAARA